MRSQRVAFYTFLIACRRVSCEIRAGEKIGICGFVLSARAQCHVVVLWCNEMCTCRRTGAGKTSLVSALFRLSDVQVCCCSPRRHWHWEVTARLPPVCYISVYQTGSIVIDGVDIMNVNLHELRSRLAIIPQVRRAHECASSRCAILCDC